MRQRGIFRSLAGLVPLIWTQLLAPDVSSAAARALRWWMHQLLFWGCLLAVAITFPLVFGWIHFGSLAGRTR